MRLLALETSGITGSVALWEGAVQAIGAESRTCRAERLFSVPLAAGQRSAQSLVPAIQRLLQSANVRPGDINVIAVTVGPGSFTGLRIGVTTAKTLAYALKAEIVAVNTLDVLARQAPCDGLRCWAVLDAFRGQLFAAAYHRDASNTWQRDDATHESALPTVEEWSAMLRAGDVVIGPVLGKLKGKLPGDVQIAPVASWEPQAETVARLALELYRQGRRDDLWNLVPYYGRLSAAEEKRGASPRL